MKEGFVTDENRFTRETWRQGGRSRLRKRTKLWGGCKTASPAFLAAAKVAGFKPGRPGYRICSAIKRDGSPCGRLAMRERGAWRFSCSGPAEEASANGKNCGVQGEGRGRRRPIAASASRIDAPASLSGGQRMDEDTISEGLDDVRVVAAGAANSTPRYVA